MKTLIALLAVAATPAMSEPARPAITGVSHIAVYSADMAKSEAFYTHDLGAMKAADPEHPLGARYYLSPQQYVELLPLPAGAGLNRLDHVAFTTADAEGLRQYLVGKQVAVPKAVTWGADGSASFTVSDPEGYRVEFVQAPKVLPAVPVNALSGHIIHVGYIIHDRSKEDRFFQDVLGFKPYWYGGFEDAKPTWISLQVPDGHDWIEYMLVSPPHGTGIPEGMSQKTAGVLNHFALGVANIEAAYTLLWNQGRLEGQSELPKIGRDAKWQLNLYDPDGTRAEIMELKAVGTPCCSPFTAEDPKE